MANVNIKLLSTKMTPSSKDKATVKLVYFNLRGRAEPCRLLLAYADQPYEDVRLTPPFVDPEGWAAKKASFSFGVLPVLYWNGEEINQGKSFKVYNTIIRHQTRYCCGEIFGQ